MTCHLFIFLFFYFFIALLLYFLTCLHLGAQNACWIMVQLDYIYTGLDRNHSEPDRTGLASVYMKAFETDPSVYLELFGTGPVEMQNWTCNSTGPVLDLFGSVLDQFQNGPL